MYQETSILWELRNKEVNGKKEPQQELCQRNKYDTECIYFGEKSSNHRCAYSCDTASSSIIISTHIYFIHTLNSSDHIAKLFSKHRTAIKPVRQISQGMQQQFRETY